LQTPPREITPLAAKRLALLDGALRQAKSNTSLRCM
jgi:hypothetical protein